MPQPMSTPTAAGMIADLVGMTEPTVAPMPMCASGIKATWSWMMGRRAARCACSMQDASMSVAQDSKLLVIVSMMFVS